MNLNNKPATAVKLRAQSLVSGGVRLTNTPSGNKVTSLRATIGTPTAPTKLRAK